MEEGVCIQVWVTDSIPERYRHLVPLDDGRSGVLVLFMAHVPAAVLASRTYRKYNGESGVGGWIREGELGLFGANAIDTYPHPGGDGILVVGSGV